ncbi:hypothetical protein [Allokutzneria albata]|uniref:Secreted protein n=1 Tax=Allokutzneria albata TaxID=211114 RepID=A0A1H0DGE2_ALLAB|nr:hypothetical protein [Allokutzneria albata]SDN69222.1 hypothetical protein SAMN04489726_7792 [Allokutzneria albata]
MKSEKRPGRFFRTGVAAAVLGAALSGLAATPASAAGGCGSGPYPPDQHINWCNEANGWGTLSTTTFWRPGGNPVEAQVVLLKDGQRVPKTVYLDRTNNPGGPHEGWVAQGQGFAGTTSVAYGLWYRGCATENGQFMCTNWVKVG